MRVPKNCIMQARTENLFGLVSEKGRISVSTRKWLNLGEYEENVESVRVSGKGRIRVTIEKLSGRVSKKGRISVSTGEW